VRKSALLAAALLAAARASAFFSPSDRGTSGAQFLEIAPGARSEAMGEAFSGVADSIEAIYYNPAGLATLQRVEVEGMSDQYFQGLTYNFAAISVPILSWVDTDKPRNSYGVLGAAVYNLSVSGIEQRTDNEAAGQVGTFNSEDLAYALSYAYSLPNTGLSLGATAKWVTSSLAGYNASAFAGDAGALYQHEKLSLGAGFRNAGSSYEFDGQGDPLPFLAYVGAGYRLGPGWLGSVEVDAPRDNNLGLAFGTEYRRGFAGKLTGAVRAGYNTLNSSAGGFSGFSMGGGLGYGNFNIDFSFTPYGDLGNSYRYALVVKF
jgi:hypothetical protein